MVAQFGRYQLPQTVALLSRKLFYICLKLLLTSDSDLHRSGLGSATEACLSDNGRSFSCPGTDKFSIFCRDCKNMKGCSIKTQDTQTCMSWEERVGAQVVDGDILIGPSDCPQQVSQ
jgi:hypothetical protein